MRLQMRALIEIFSRNNDTLRYFCYSNRLHFIGDSQFRTCTTSQGDFRDRRRARISDTVDSSQSSEPAANNN